MGTKRVKGREEGDGGGAVVGSHFLVHGKDGICLLRRRRPCHALSSRPHSFRFHRAIAYRTCHVLPRSSWTVQRTPMPPPLQDPLRYARTLPMHCLQAPAFRRTTPTQDALFPNVKAIWSPCFFLHGSPEGPSESDLPTLGRRHRRCWSPCPPAAGGWGNLGSYDWFSSGFRVLRLRCRGIGSERIKVLQLAPNQGSFMEERWRVGVWSRSLDIISFFL
jgi:hypothetical protein